MLHPTRELLGRARHLAVLVGVAAALVACSSAGLPPLDGATDDVADTGADAADIASPDIGTFDGGGGPSDVEGDAPSDDATVDGGFDVREDVDATTAPDTPATCTEAGCPCETDRDCDGACVGGGVASTRFCADRCDDDCPDGLVCAPYWDYADRIARLCVPETSSACSPCEVDSDCPEIGSACIEQPDGRRCMLPCGPNGRCADGTDCGARGVTAGLCAPAFEVCTACLDADGDGFGIGERCFGSDCDDTTATTRPRAPELCNGVDDDCDLDVDEGIDVLTDPANCGACGVACTYARAGATCTDGVCAMGDCEAGWADCNDDPADGCEEHLDGPTSCGTCAELPAVPGDPCGTCGTWTCDGDGGLECIDEAGDTDGDGVCDADDACAGFDDTVDPDGDGVPTACDACPFHGPDDPDADGVCGPPAPDPDVAVIADGRNREWTLAGYYRGNVYEATADGTLRAFGQYLLLDAPCEVGTFVLESTTDETGPWTVLAANEQVAPAGEGYVQSPAWNVPVVAGRWYALGMGWTCAATYYGDDGMDWRGTDVGVGVYRTTVWDNAYVYTPTFVPENTGSSGQAYTQQVLWSP